MGRGHSPHRTAAVGAEPGGSRKRDEDETMGQKEGRSSNAWHGHFEPKRVPEKVWIGCEGCQATLFRKQVEQNLLVCPECNHHFTVSAAERIAQLLDPDTFEEWFADLAADRSPPVQRSPSLPRARPVRAGADRPEGSRRGRPGVHPRNPHRFRHHR